MEFDGFSRDVQTFNESEFPAISSPLPSQHYIRSCRFNMHVYSSVF